MLDFAARLLGPWVRRVDASTLRADALAGLLGALLVLPQGFAFAALAGLPPEYGLYTAIVPCIVAALFGSSLHVVSGPTNANSLALFATLTPLAAAGSPEYIQLALAVTVMVGVMQWLIGALHLGSLANFISPSALRGFMTGAAALIALHALTDLLGVAGPTSHGTGALLLHLARHLDKVNPGAVLVGMLTLAIVLTIRRTFPRTPYMLIGLIASSAISAWLNLATWRGLARVDTVGAVPPIVPHFHWPGVDLARVPELLSIAFALTIVALGQSISIAKAVASRSGQIIDANREFRGQGLSNIVGGFFSSYVACGSLNRSMPNLEAGARTPLAAVFASICVLLLLALTGPLLSLIAMPAIAALLLVISWSLFDVPGWRRLFSRSRQDFAIAAVTGLATMSIRLEMAILLGTTLSLLTYLYRTARPSVRAMGFDASADGAEGIERPFVVLDSTPQPLPECPQLKLIRMEGDVYFGAVPWVADQLREIHPDPDGPKHLLIMAKSMNFIDMAGAELWSRELTARRLVGGDLYFHRPRPSVIALWQRTGFIADLGDDHLFPTKRVAIATIFECLDRGICAHCTVRLFAECQRLPLPNGLPEPSNDVAAPTR